MVAEDLVQVVGIRLEALEVSAAARLEAEDRVAVGSNQLSSQKPISILLQDFIH